MARGDTTFSSVSSEGGLLPAGLLARISAGDPDLPGLEPEDFGLPKLGRINEETSRLWENAKSDWAAFQASIEAEGSEGSVTETRTRWLLPFFEHLGYGRLVFR